MATSGSSDFAVTRDQIIKKAAVKIKAIAAGATLDNQTQVDFSLELNAIVKGWAAIGHHVWTINEATLFPAVSQGRYALSATSSDHCTDTYDYQTTTLSAAEASGQTVLSVTSSADMAASDYVGIVMDDGSLHWSTISSVDSSTQITIADATDDDAASGNYVFGYTTKIVRPLKITAARRYNYETGDSSLITPIARIDYQDLTTKEDTGVVNQFFYDQQASIGYLNLWYEPEDLDELVRFTYHRPIEDFDAAGNNPDFPQEWYGALWWNLALAMAPEYDVPTDKFRQIADMAVMNLGLVTGYDREVEDVQFAPDMTGYE